MRPGFRNLNTPDILAYAVLCCSNALFVMECDASTHQILEASHTCDNEKCPDTLASVPLGNKKGLLENTCPGGRWQIGAQRRRDGLHSESP